MDSFILIYCEPYSSSLFTVMYPPKGFEASRTADSDDWPLSPESVASPEEAFLGSPPNAMAVYTQEEVEVAAY